jgi:NADH-quinone oxidoreductase subunit K
VIDPRMVLVLSAVLLALGVVGVLTRRGAISILMCVELMLNAGNLAFITFSRINGGPQAQLFVFFVMALAAAEAAAGLAIVIALFRLRGTTDVDEINLLKW